MDVRKLHKTHEQLEHGHDSLTNGVDSLSNIIENQHSKLSSIEQFSSQRNVYVTGIPERRDENPEGTGSTNHLNHSVVCLSGALSNFLIRNGTRVICKKVKNGIC